MARSGWLLVILIIILTSVSFWYGRNRQTPDWMKCKESLFDQVVFKKCTPSSFSRPKNSEVLDDNISNPENKKKNE